MTGTTIATLSGSGALGQYDDATGAMTATFDLSGSGIGAGSTMTMSTQLSNTLIFNGIFGTLGNPALLNVAFNFVGGSPPAELVDTTLGFMAGFVCCGNNGDDPNSFHVNSPSDAVMSLWGADDFTIATPGYTDPNFGMDLRISLTTGATDIPEPMSMALFSIGLAGLGMTRRRKTVK